MTPHLRNLENEAIYTFRDGLAHAKNPVLLFSGGKDSTVLAYLCARACYPGRPPLPLLHIDSTWEFAEVLVFRDRFAQEFGFELIVHSNDQYARDEINPFDNEESYTTLMRTQALRQALDRGRFDVVFGGARRDEEASRSKERIVSIRGPNHSWDPRRQRPELWRLFNWQIEQDESIRAFPLSNWTEQDIWHYISARDIPLAPLYFAAPRLVAFRDEMMIVVDDRTRMKWEPGQTAAVQSVRFRTLGCWPVTGAVASNAADLKSVIEETLSSRWSERSGRNAGGTLERQKREGYF